MADLSVGAEFAGCRIEGVAGRGGMGVVYRATQLALDRLVALKVIAPDLARDESFRARFQREARLGASIEHPNILPVYEAGERDGVLFLTSRYVEGTDLRALLHHDGPLDPGRAAALLAPVALALNAAHQRGLVHRDVKPANVLIAAPGDAEHEHVYLTDFGIARGEGMAGGEMTMTRTGAFVGTLDYMAPEQMTGQRGAMMCRDEARHRASGSRTIAASSGPTQRRCRQCRALDRRRPPAGRRARGSGPAYVVGPVGRRPRQDARLCSVRSERSGAARRGTRPRPSAPLLPLDRRGRL